jgi:uncharacterized protein
VTTEPPDMIEVEVMYAELEQVWQCKMCLPKNSTVADALAFAQLRTDWPGISINTEHLAVYGQTANLQTKLHEYDRVEILRPLQIDPMDARRSRAVKKQV